VEATGESVKQGSMTERIPSRSKDLRDENTDALAGVSDSAEESQERRTCECTRGMCKSGESPDCNGACGDFLR